MFETFGIVTSQVAMLFILIAVGYFLCRRGIMTDSVRAGMTAVLLDVVTPCVIISELQEERTPERMTALGVTAGVFALCIISFILLSYLLTVPSRRREQDPRADCTRRMCMVYSNCGFMGLPLLASLDGILGGDALFYGSVIVGVFNLFMFTHGVSLFSSAGGETVSLKKKLKMLLNPAVAGVFIGLGLFFSGITLPAVIGKPVEYLGSMNTPLAMLVIGGIICRCDIKRVLTDKRIYFPALTRNLLFPALVMGVLFLFHLSSPVLLICLIIASCPTAGNCALFSERYGGDSKLASGIFFLSTVLSAVTVPIIASVAAVIL